MTNQDDTLLEEALEQVQQTQDQPTDEWQPTTDNELDYKALYEETKKKLEESELTCKRAQSDYFRQKMEFDALVARREEEKKTEKVDAVITLAQKIIPGLANLQVSLNHIPADLVENKRVEGVQMTADKQLKDIEALGISLEVPEIGTDVDFNKVVPVGTESVENELLKGKISKVLDNIYIYKKDGIEKIVLPGKVIVGA
jgi:molecular chaperone GrpE (heat shock protein)